MQQIKNLFFKKNHFNSLQTIYKVPKEYIDCKKLSQNRQRQKKQYRPIQISSKDKLTKFKKTFILDQQIKPFKQLPSPNKYTQTYSTIKRYKSQSTFIKRSKQSENLGKRPTWIQDIQKYEQKHKLPAANKYVTQSKSDFLVKKKAQSLQRLLKNGQKFNYMDDTMYISSQIPGPGAHNPHKPLKKLKVNMMTIQSVRKHQQQKKKLKKKLSQSSLSNVSCCSYSPVKDKTFDSINKQKKKESTLMRLTNIDKRVGMKSLYLSPGPGAHNTINKWANQTFKRQNIIGNLNLFGRTTKSFPTLRVYH